MHGITDYDAIGVVASCQEAGHARIMSEPLRIARRTVTTISKLNRVASWGLVKSLWSTCLGFGVVLFGGISLCCAYGSEQVSSSDVTTQITGVVLDTQGDPVKGADIRVYPFEDSLRAVLYLEQDPVASTATDEEGRFRIGPVPIGAAGIVIAMHEGTAPALRHFVTSQHTRPLDIHLREASALDVSLSPCNWLAVIAVDEESIYRLADLDSNCVGTLKNLAPGRVTVFPWAKERGEQGFGYTTVVQPSKKARLDILLSGSVLGGVVRQGSRGISHVLVEIDAVASEQGGTLVGETDKDGRFEFFELDPGQWNVVVHCEQGLVREQVAIQSGQRTEIDLDLNCDR